MAALVLVLPGKARAADVPAWIRSEVESQSSVLSGLLDLPRVPFIELSYSRGAAPEGLRVVHGEAQPERVDIKLTGDWIEPTAPARELLIRNLAHELAHVYQHSLGFPAEKTFLHEGFAEALAYEALQACPGSCGADPAGLMRSMESKCADAMKEGPILSTRSNEAYYGCGGVLAHMAAESSNLKVTEFYARFGSTKRRIADFLALLEEAGGKRYSLSARTFLTADHRLARPERVLQRLRAGRL